MYLLYTLLDEAQHFEIIVSATYGAQVGRPKQVPAIPIDDCESALDQVVNVAVCELSILRKRSIPDNLDDRAVSKEVVAPLQKVLDGRTLPAIDGVQVVAQALTRDRGKVFKIGRPLQQRLGYGTQSQCVSMVVVDAAERKECRVLKTTQHHRPKALRLSERKRVRLVCFSELLEQRPFFQQSPEVKADRVEEFSELVGCLDGPDQIRPTYWLHGSARPYYGAVRRRRYVT